MGTARGLRLPGILPEPGVIEPEGDELSGAERAVLADLDKALPAEDHDEDTALEAGPVAPLAQERPRSQVPWWLGSLFFTAAAAASALAAAIEGRWWLRIVFVVAAGAWLWLAVQSWRHRSSR